MTIKELHKTAYPAIDFYLWTGKGKETKIDREDPLMIQAFADIVIDVIETANDLGALRIVPKMQLIKKSEV